MPRFGQLFVSLAVPRLVVFAENKGSPYATFGKGLLKARLRFGLYEKDREKAKQEIQIPILALRNTPRTALQAYYAPFDCLVFSSSAF